MVVRNIVFAFAATALQTCAAENPDVGPPVFFKLARDLLLYSHHGSARIVLPSGGDDYLWSDVLESASNAHLIELLRLETADEQALLENLKFGQTEADVLSLIVCSGKSCQDMIVDLARIGAMERGLWILPKELFPDPNEIKSRFDSHIYLYRMRQSSSNITEVELTEVFSVKQTHKFLNKLATWTPALGLNFLASESIWDRRQYYLRDVELRGVHVMWHPFTYIEKLPNGTTITYGILPDIMKLFQDVAKFKFVEYEPPDGKWGAPENYSDLDGDWNGAINEVRRGRADFSHAAFSMTLERNRVISYGMPYYSDAFTFIVPRQTGTVVNLSAFLKTFTLNSWVLILLAIMAGSLCLLVTKNQIHGPLNAEKFACSFGAVCAGYLSRDTTLAREESLSFKVVWLTNCISGLAIFTFYTCDLTASMTAKSPEQEISSFKDILDKGYQTLVLDDTADSLTMQNSPRGTVLHDIYFKTMMGKEEFHVKDAEELHKKVMSGPKYAVFATASAAFGNKDLVPLNLFEAISDNFAPVYQKDSELVEVFNHHFKKLEESGAMNRIRKKYFGPDWKAPPSSSIPAVEAEVLGFDNLFLPCALALMGLLSAGLIAALERCAMKRPTQKLL